MIDFEIPEDARAIRDKVRKFVQEECIPAEETCNADNFEAVKTELRNKARNQGLWCPFIPVEHGGMAYAPWQMHWFKWNLEKVSLVPCR